MNACQVRNRFCCPSPIRDYGMCNVNATLVGGSFSQYSINFSSRTVPGMIRKFQTSVLECAECAGSLERG